MRLGTSHSLQFVGKPCKRGHAGLRYQSSRACVDCVKQMTYERNNKDRQAYNLAQRAANKYQRCSNPIRHRALSMVRQAAYRDRLKEAVMNVYTDGEQSCRRCGQADIDVLCLDHVNNDGTKHRKQLAKGRTGFRDTYKWVIRNDYPPIFQVLCYNCNAKKAIERCRSKVLETAKPYTYYNTSVGPAYGY